MYHSRTPRIGGTVATAVRFFTALGRSGWYAIPPQTMSLEHSESRTANAPTGDGSNAIKHMHDVFSNWERRAILYVLSERSEQTDLDGIAEHVAAWRRGDESPTSPPEGPADATVGPTDERSRLRRHVAQMDEFGILSYDPDEETVHLCEDVRVAVSPPWTDRGGPEPGSPPTLPEGRGDRSD